MREACWGESQWGVRRLLGHVKHLPRDSAFARSLSGPAAYWDENAELLANIFDSVERLTYYTLKVNGNDVDVPKPYPRPGAADAVPEMVSLTDFSAFLGG